MNQVTYDILTQRIKLLGNLPAMPAILATLCEALSRKTSQIDMEKIVRQISYDKSLAAQRLRMANSALFRQRGDVSTVKDAVVALGLWRIRDLVFSCSLPMMFAHVKTTVGKEGILAALTGNGCSCSGIGIRTRRAISRRCLFGGPSGSHRRARKRHAVHRRFSRCAGGGDGGNTHRPLELVEQRILGFTHAESGRILAELWRLPVEFGGGDRTSHRPAKAESAERRHGIGARRGSGLPEPGPRLWLPTGSPRGNFTAAHLEKSRNRAFQSRVHYAKRHSPNWWSI